MYKIRKQILPGIFIGLLILLAGVSVFAEGETKLLMATTTSTDNTGLLDYLAPKFKEASGIDLRWTATGTGKALKLAENCDVDVVLVHDPASEEKFVSDGFGIDRREIMFNDFVIIGPSQDPAVIKGKTIKEAMNAIRTNKSFFISRGDDSGTHKKEISLWKTANAAVPEKESWYIQTGQGMLQTINIAEERNGYTLTDRATYFKYEDNMKGRPPLIILIEGDPELINQYSVIAVNPKHCAKVKNDLAMKFIEWIAGAEGQKAVSDFKIGGKQLFTPNAKK